MADFDNGSPPQSTDISTYMINAAAISCSLVEEFNNQSIQALTIQATEPDIMSIASVNSINIASGSAGKLLILMYM